MPPTASEAIIYTSSEDGFLLEGLHIQPTDAPPQPVGVIWIHGNAGRFYDYPYIMIGRSLAQRGYPFISANTRGHDISAFMWQAAEGKPRPWQSPQDMPVGRGSGWDRLAEAPRDLAAWVDAATKMGMGKVVLIGHSSGAQRVVLYAAERPDARVAGLALASPDLRGFMPPGETAQAQQMLSEGRGMEVLPAQPFAPWYRQSAESVANRAEVLAHLLVASEGEPTIAAIQVPLLAFFGAREPGGAATLATIAEQARAARSDTQIIEGADHIYTDYETTIADVIAHWMTTLN